MHVVTNLFENMHNITYTVLLHRSIVYTCRFEWECTGVCGCAGCTVDKRDK